MAVPHGAELTLTLWVEFLIIVYHHPLNRVVINYTLLTNYLIGIRLAILTYDGMTLIEARITNKMFLTVEEMHLLCFIEELT